MSNTGTFDSVLEMIRKESKGDKVKLGTKFEVLIKKFFETDPMKKQEYSNVWLWSEDDCPGRKETLKKLGKSKKDYGIDLVAQNHDGTLCAIQCKCYADDTHLQEKDASNFIALANSKQNGKKIFENAIFVWTGQELSPGVKLILENNGCQMLDRSVLKDSVVNWPSLITKKPKRKEPYKIRPHQKEAQDKVITGFKEDDRGKLVMACGTGKTFTTLKIAERQVGKDGAVLYLVPSISLLSQSMREWAEQATMTHRYVAVCSDTKVGKDSEDASLSELETRPTTNPNEIAKKMQTNPQHMTVIFSTYQSIMQVSRAQKKSGMIFDLTICDEAHRTTGVVKDEMTRNDIQIKDSDKESISGFVAVHQNNIIRSKKRLYTTATPKIYTDSSMDRAKKGYGLSTYSMNNEKVYGPEFYSLTFDKAINLGLLSDYKVVIMTVGEENVTNITQSVAEKDQTLRITNVAKWIGCWKGLCNPDRDRQKKHPLQRAIAFTQSIANSERFAQSFTDVVGEVDLPNMKAVTSVVKHVDGSHDALNRKRKLDWLKESHDALDECRILSNARCLSEGVDVPALDAVIFLNPKESMIDVIQAVGRVMRKAENKDYGYVIVPVAIPPGIDDPERVLDDAKTYKVVWSVLRALRAHDSKRFEQRMLDGNVLSDVIIWEPPEPCIDCQHGICSRHAKKEDCKDCAAEYEGSGKPCKKHAPRTSTIMDIPTHLIQSKIVEKISDRRYLENWADDVANIVSRSTSRINELYKSNKKIRSELDGFHAGLKKIINDAISHDDAVDMLSQHMVMGRVFDALFKKENFTEHNPISKTMNRILESLATKGLKAEMEDLEGFYNDIDAKVSSIQTHEARQKVIHQLYDKFFNNAFKKTAERLGIVYTPIEIVDFILKSVDYAMRENFDRGLSARNVNVIDPFTGTGSFITRLMSKELNLIKDRDLEYKYKNNLFANEIVLLAYYIAAINCESTFFERYNQYMPFGGITLTDTFHAKKIDDEWNEGLFTETQKRIEKQRKSSITAVISNPPYSVGQSNFNDDNPNIEYPNINDRIKETYLKKLKVINPTIGAKNSLYDSYVRAIRWASDRIGDSGVIGFVTNASFIRSGVGAGIRACLKEEFTDVWVFDLLGKKGLEGHGRNVFEYPGVSTGGTTTQIAIIILVKNPDKKKHTIHYRALTKADYSGPDKRLEIKKLDSIENIKVWQEIEPDKHHDWLDHRSDEFVNYLPMGSKDAKAGKGNAVFHTYSRGVVTGRDVWAYNASFKILANNMRRHIKYCNMQDPNKPKIDKKQASWDSHLSRKLLKNKPNFTKKKIRFALYRPFIKQYLYYDKIYNQEQLGPPPFFPKPDSKNIVICVPDKGAGENFSTLVTDKTPDLSLVSPTQCFPLYVYEYGDNTRKDNITDHTLQEYKTHYKNKKISKTDIFYYIYGLLHHARYKEKYANNLSKVLPHIPMAPDFWTFSKIGKELVKLHLSYETCKRHKLGKPKNKFGKYKKMAFAKKKDVKTGRQVDDKTTLKINGIEAFDNIPETNYRVNGRTPLEWAINRYKITVNKDSGIVNDATNIDVIPLIERLVYVGVESDRLVSQLPKEFEPKNWKPKKTGLDTYNTSK